MATSRNRNVSRILSTSLGKFANGIVTFETNTTSESLACNRTLSLSHSWHASAKGGRGAVGSARAACCSPANCPNGAIPRDSDTVLVAFVSEIESNGPRSVSPSSILISSLFSSVCVEQSGISCNFQLIFKVNVLCFPLATNVLESRLSICNKSA